MNESYTTDMAVLERTGERLARRRIELGLTQADLAREAGIGRATVERMEAGRSTQLSSFVRVLRALELLASFEQLIPEQGPSPMALVRKRPAPRQRASGKRTRSRKSPKLWQWGDNQ